jgi:signal transduction histidine kinase
VSEEPPGPAFPDGPKLELDQLLAQLIGRAQDVIAAQGRLRGLLRANQSFVGSLTLPVLLDRIVRAACELTQARYGAIGVIDPAGGGLEEFVYVGIDGDTAARIGHLPEGKGLLGALIKDPQPIRLPRMTDDDRSAGFPDHHPGMTSFLGVPILVRGEVFGNLYLTERAGGEFTTEDEELVTALAVTGGVAIQNARLYQEAQRRQDWLQASTEIAQQLLSAQGEEPLRLIARQACQVADADVATVVLPTADGQRLIVEVATGLGAEELTALTSPIEGTLVGLAFKSGRPVLVADVNEDEKHSVHLSQVVPVGPVMVLPLGGSHHVRGALVIGRLRGHRRFADADLDMATTFAHHAAIALELADARADQQRIVLLEERDRIARDLHDHVIQRLFALGLTVQSVANALGDRGAATRLDQVVVDIDETIRQTRTSIFQLRGPLGPETGSVRTRLLAVAAEVSQMLGFEPDVSFAGPVDAVVPEPVVDDLVAVLREALTNVARHAEASSVQVGVSTTTSTLTLTVKDDGVGLGETERRSGLANLRQRAEHHGGRLTLRDHPRDDEDTDKPLHRGTHLTWTIPLT